MQIIVNGQAREVTAAQTISALLRDAGFQGHRVAVEVNLEIIPRGCHDRHALSEGDRVEIIQAIGGG